MLLGSKNDKKKFYLLAFILYIFFLSIIPCHAEEAANNYTQEKSLYPALLGGVFTNVVFNVTCRIFGMDHFQTSFESMKANLASNWEWDNNAFLFNHPGHPYQGGLYHNAARSNGFNFYEAMFFDSIGSLTWELFGETEIPALNDLIVTTFGGAAFGEMLHLLYLEIKSPWLGALVSPMDALNNAIFRRTPAKTNNLYYLSTMAIFGWVQTVKEDARQGLLLGNELNHSYLYTGNVGCEIIYGDPFMQSSKKPYSHFEIKMLLGGSFIPAWLDWTILTDGCLVSWNPAYTEKDTLSTGLTLHYDLITGNNINYANNGLDWTIKWQHKFTASRLELKSHIGWSIFGSSEYYPFAEIISTNLKPNEAVNNYGTGANVKIFFTLQSQQYGKFTLGACNYLLYIIPWDNINGGGIEFFNMSFFEYAYPFTKSLSVVVGNSLYLKSGTSHRETNVTTVTNRISLGVQWTFIDKLING